MAEDKVPQEGAPAPSVSLLVRLSDIVNIWCERLLFLLMVAMIFFTTMQVIFRVFFTALSWSEEITCFLLVYATLVGTGVAFKRGSHIAVTFIVQRLPGAGQKALAVSVQLLGVAFFSVMAFYGALLVKTEALQTSPALQIPMSWVYAVFPVLGSIIILHLLAGMRQTFGKG